MEIIGFKDVHLAERAPRSRIDDYCEAILAKIEFALETATKLGAVTLLDAGDFFHVKEPSRVSHALVRRVFQLYMKYLIPKDAVYGNHETPFYNLREAAEKHPKGVLFEAGLINHLTPEGKVYVEGDLRVRVVGFDFDAKEAERETPWFQRIHREADDDFVICVAHTFAGPRGGTVFGGDIRWGYDQIAAEGKADAYFFGHEHVDQGIENVDGKWFINNGALSRGSLTDDELSRAVTLMRLSITKKGITPSLIQVPVQPALDVFDFGKPDVGPDEAESVDFIARLALSKPTDLDKLLLEAPFSDKAKRQAQNYLAQFGG